MSEGQPPPKRVRLSEDSLKELKREDLVHRWKQQDSYINFLESKAHRSSDDDSEEKLRQMHSEFTRKEKIQILRLSTKEQEFQELANKLAEISKGQSPGATQLRSTLLDPALNLLFQRMKKELEDKTKQLQQAQEDMSAWKFTSDSQTGKRLMARCRTLLQENQDLGKQVSSGKIANLDAELAMQKKYNEELKGSQDELYEMVVQLNEEGEGMQSTICALQQQLKEVTNKLSKYEDIQPAAGTTPDQPSNDTVMLDAAERTAIPPLEEGPGNSSQNAKDSGIEGESMDVGHAMVSEIKDPLDSLKEPSLIHSVEEPQQAGNVNKEISLGNNERTSATDPSNNDDNRLENATTNETNNTLEGSQEQYAKQEETVSQSTRTTAGVDDGRTSPLVTETDQQPEEPMETEVRGDDGVERTTRQSPVGGGDDDGRTAQSLPVGDDERTTTHQGPESASLDDKPDSPAPSDERTPWTKVDIRQPETQPPSGGQDASNGDTVESNPEKERSNSEGDEEGLDFRTTNTMTPASPPDQSTGDVEMAQPIRDHPDEPGRTEGALLDRTENSTEEDAEDPVEKIEIIGKDDKSENVNIRKESLKNDVIVEKLKEPVDKCAEIVEGDEKMNSGENDSNDNMKNVDEAENNELGESNCLEVEEEPGSNPASPENNGEVTTLTPLSPQACPNEGIDLNNDAKPCLLSNQSEAVGVIKTTNGVQKGILSKDSSALPLVHSSQMDVNCTSNAKGEERTNGPKEEEEDEGGLVPVRTDSPESKEDLTAE